MENNKPSFYIVRLFLMRMFIGFTHYPVVICSSITGIILSLLSIESPFKHLLLVIVLAIGIMFKIYYQVSPVYPGRRFAYTFVFFFLWILDVSVGFLIMISNTLVHELIALSLFFIITILLTIENYINDIE